MKVNLSDVFKIPNLITLVRVVLVPYIVWALQSPKHAALAFGLFVAAAVTDYLDGKLARWLHETTQLGELFDPIADKLLLSSMFIALAFEYAIPWWLVIVVVGRDVYILIAAMACISCTSIRKFPPSFYGKLSTFAQIAFVWMVLMSDAFHLVFSGLFIATLAFLVFGLTIVSGLDYTQQGIRRWQEKRM